MHDGMSCNIFSNFKIELYYIIIKYKSKYVKHLSQEFICMTNRTCTPKMTCPSIYNDTKCTAKNNGGKIFRIEFPVHCTYTNQIPFQSVWSHIRIVMLHRLKKDVFLFDYDNRNKKKIYENSSYGRFHALSSPISLQVVRTHSEITHVMTTKDE